MELRGLGVGDQGIFRMRWTKGHQSSLAAIAAALAASWGNDRPTLDSRGSSGRRASRSGVPSATAGDAGSPPPGTYSASLLLLLLLLLLPCRWRARWSSESWPTEREGSRAGGSGGAEMVPLVTSKAVDPLRFQLPSHLRCAPSFSLLPPQRSCFVLCRNQITGHTGIQGRASPSRHQ